MTEQPLQAQSVEIFLDTLASKAATPGGGSVAALNGAMAAGLISMVCALSIGKKKFAEIEDELRGIHDRAESLRQELQELAQADVEVFGRLATAYKLPRTTDADAASRNAAIQTITRQAADVPLRVARAAAAILPLCDSLASRAGRLIVSDVGVAAALAQATLQSAILNIEINLSGLEDQIYVRTVRSEIDELSAGVPATTDAILNTVRERINRD
jgi:formiminotetrahydrofolate cyclodeaminase